ncbi:MAG: DUF4359 domain-containing protein [Syntrophomonadales bacterium]|jgi:hypothetical protein
MGKIASLLLIILIAAVMVSTNPTKEQYVEWAVSQLSNATQNEQDSIEEILKDWGIRTFAPSVIRETTSQRNYYLFSLYTTQIGEDHVTAVGALNQFVFIESTIDPETLGYLKNVLNLQSPPLKV